VTNQRITSASLLRRTKAWWAPTIYSRLSHPSAYPISSTAIATLLLSLVIATVWWQFIVSPTDSRTPASENKSETPQSLDPVEVVSLYRLFKEDVPGVKSVDFRPRRIHDLGVEPRLHADFVGLSKFVSFYVPSSPVVRDVIRFIADNYEELTGLNLIELVLTKPGEYPQSTDGMKFTGSVVIYYEDALSNADLANLENYYRIRQLTPIWRSTAYVQTQILLRNNREALLKLSQVPSSIGEPTDQMSISGITAGVNGEQIRIGTKEKDVTWPVSTPDTEASPH
jgi:hypothetical protein